MSELKLTGLTVEELIAQLQGLDPKAVVVGDGGEGTVEPVVQVRPGHVYQYRQGGHIYGMSQYMHVKKKEDAPPDKPNWPAVYIGW